MSDAGAGAPSEGRALVVRRPGEWALESRSVPAPGPDEVTVRPAHVGLCGTDLEILDGGLDEAHVRYPVVLGHEWSGHVVARGAGVLTPECDDPVVVEGILACGHCAPCRTGRTNLCENYAELGFTVDGAIGPAVTVPARFVHRLASEVSLVGAALVEPSAVVLRGLLEIRPRPGWRVLVVGDGAVALLAALLAAQWAPAKVDMVGMRADQGALAERIGVAHFGTARPPARTYDLVVEAAGSTAAVETALEAVAVAGRVLVLGIAGSGEAARLRVDDLVNHDITLRGSFSYTTDAWTRTVALVNSGRFDPGVLVTHRFALDDHAAAVAALRGPTDGPRGKVLFDLTRPGAPKEPSHVPRARTH